MDRTDVQKTLREMWETRPARAREGRQLAGVAAAVARRYDIDPVLVRVGFVVAAFYGIGAVLYIAGWALLPEEEVTGSRATGSRPRMLLLVGLAVSVVVGVGQILGGGVDVLLPAVAVAGLLFLLHRSRAHRGPGAPAGDPGASPTVPGVTSLDPAAPAVQPPAWDPLGVAPFAWDLPEPSPVPPPPPPRRRPPVTAVTLALALLAGGVLSIVMLAGGGFGMLPIVLGVVLAVLGVGLVLGAFLRTGRGLVPVALLVGALTYGVLAAPFERWDGEVGDVRHTPASVGEVAPLYEQDLGSLELDLRQVDLSVPAGTAPTPLRTVVRIGAGQVEVRVPPNADLTLRAGAGIGAVQYAGRASDGPGAQLSVTDDLGADGVRSGRLLVLDIEAGAGNVEVHRG